MTPLHLPHALAHPAIPRSLPIDQPPAHVVLIGCGEIPATLIAWASAHDLTLIVVSPQTFRRSWPQVARSASMFVVPLDVARDVADELLLSHTPWVGWSLSDSPASAVEGYQLGAALVLPPTLDDQAVARLSSVLRRDSSSKTDATPVQRVYRRGQIIPADQRAFIEICEGYVALVALHPSGTEALLALYGPGHLLLVEEHQCDSVQFVAHTAVRLVLHAWNQPAPALDVTARVRQQLGLVLAWAAAQALPFAEDRLVAVLALLAREFGRSHSRGTLIDVRLSHAQLATAVRLTRPTVTRLLGLLRRRGVVDWVGAGHNRRICLLAGEHRPALHQPGAQPQLAR